MKQVLTAINRVLTLVLTTGPGFVILGTIAPTDYVGRCFSRYLRLTLQGQRTILIPDEATANGYPDIFEDHVIYLGYSKPTTDRLRDESRGFKAFFRIEDAPKWWVYVKYFFSGQIVVPISALIKAGVIPATWKDATS